jgi:hypothetical protein
MAPGEATLGAAVATGLRLAAGDERAQLQGNQVNMHRS